MFTPEQVTISESKGIDSECCTEDQLESLFDAAVDSMNKVCSSNSQSVLSSFEWFDRLKNQIEEILALWPTWREKLGLMWEKCEMMDVESMEQEESSLDTAPAATQRKRSLEEPRAD